MRTSATIRAYSFLAVLLLASLFAAACASDSSPTPDGDLDSESDAELDIDGDLDLEIEERPRPYSVKGARQPKLHWRDEVATGYAFVWGFMPRDYYPDHVPDDTAYMPIAWDAKNRRVLVVDNGEDNYDMNGYDAAIYSVTEEGSEVLGRIQMPDTGIPGWRWQEYPPLIRGIALVGDRLFFSFYKDGWYFDNPDYSASGVLAYDLVTKDVEYQCMETHQVGVVKGNLFGQMIVKDENTLIVRRSEVFESSSMYELDLRTKQLQSLSLACADGQENLSDCNRMMSFGGYQDGFYRPTANVDGFAHFATWPARLTLRQDGGVDVIALSDDTSECKDYYKYEECGADWLPFSMNCCLWSRHVVPYAGTFYVFSWTHSTFFEVDLERGGYQRQAGLLVGHGEDAPPLDGSPHDDVWLGKTKAWLITDDGDLLWVNMYDYSIRGIAGPLDEWAK